MRVDFLDTADAEFIETIAYYNLQSEGLGYEFASEVKRALERILQYPKAWAPLSKRIAYFKAMASQTGIPYQNLINLYLRECVLSQRKLRMKWAS